MQKVATKVFIVSSVAFGLIGILVMITAPGNQETDADLNIVLYKLLGITGFIVLSSFALSVAGKYLNSGD